MTALHTDKVSTIGLNATSSFSNRILTVTVLDIFTPRLNHATLTCPLLIFTELHSLLEQL